MLTIITIPQGAGFVGKYILKELVDQGFQVTVLSRGQKQDDFPKGVTVKQVNYDDIESLKTALSGQDAVVSAIGSSALGAQQQTLADAAYAAGVKRFIPSEFGVNTRKVDGLPIAKLVGAKVELVDDLQKKANENSNFSWTSVANGLFFEFVSASPLPRSSPAIIWPITDISRNLKAGARRLRRQGKEGNYL